MSAALSPPSSVLISVGSPWRAALRRPVFGSMLLACAFFLYTAPVKETPVLFDHAPWLNDPFDTVISFMMFFVPLIAVFCAPRVMLCRKSEPLPAARVRDILRGCRVVVTGVSLTLLTEWIALVIEDNRAQWNRATWLQVALLGVMSVATLTLIRELGRVGLPRPGADEATASPDWIFDSCLLIRQQSHLLGPARGPALRLLDWADRRLVTAIRTHPVWTAIAGCAVFGAAVGINQGIREGYFVSVTIVACILLAAGMLGLLLASGSYLGLIRSNSPLTGTRRRQLDAVAITCIGILVPFAMRNHMWWLVGSHNSAAGPSQLLQLLAIFAAAIFGLTCLAESLLHLHHDPARRGS